LTHNHDIDTQSISGAQSINCRSHIALKQLLNLLVLQQQCVIGGADSSI